jgi:hypothetical protein
VNLEALVRPELESGVPGGAELLEFAAAVIGPSRARLDAARAALAARLSAQTVTAASAIAGNFSKNDRIANAIGIPADARDLGPSREMRKQLGLDDFASARNTFRHFPDE